MRATATRRIIAWGFAALAAAGLPFAAPAQAQVTFDLCASTGTLTMPDGVVVNIWGFSLFGNVTAGVCDPAQIPGPVLIVTEGDDVTVNLADSLPQTATLEFPGQEDVAATGSSYSFTATAPGTYLYEAGTNPGIQIPMGLYGALIVRPAVSPDQAYADPSTAFDAEQVLVLSEIDPDLNNLLNPNDFDRNLYDPVYWLINGEAYPNADPVSVLPDNRLLLRYLNAGSTHYTMTLLGLRQDMIAMDSDPLVGPPDLSLDLVSQTIPTGQTADMLVDAPAAPGRFPLYNRQMRLTNALPAANPAHFPGGMMTFVTVPARLFFSTAAATAVPGVCPGLAPNVCDNADIYAWSGAGFGRVFDGSGVGLAAGADIDALMVEDFDTFYMSFSTDAGTTVPAPVGLAQDEDVVKYDAGAWSLYFDGSLVGLGDGNAEDVDGFEILDDGSVLVSTAGAPVDASIPASPAPQDEDLLRCEATFPAPAACTWTLYFEGSDVGLATAASEDIDGVAVSGSDIYLSTLGAFGVPAPTATLSGVGVDVFACNGAAPEPTTSCTSFSMFFDGSAEALPGLIDALDLP